MVSNHRPNPLLPYPRDMSVRVQGKDGGLWSGIWSEAQFTRLHIITPWSEDLFIHKPAQLPGEHTAWLPFPGHGTIQRVFKYTNLPYPTRYPLTPGSRECTCGQSALPRSTTSQHNSAQPGIEPMMSPL